MAGGQSDVASVEDITGRMAVLHRRIIEAGGDLERIRIVAVTKAFPPELIPQALAAGLIDLGENYGQELQAKARWLAGRGDDPGGNDPGAATEPRWHFIGGLQRNKVKHLAPLVYLWHSVDRASLVTEIAKRAPGARILIQVNTSGEGAKSGCEPDTAPELVDLARRSGLDVQGLMTVGPTDAARDPGPGFAALAALADRLDLVERSMGMSGDVEAAIAEGATMIRVGTSLFGPRAARPSAPDENHRPGSRA